MGRNWGVGKVGGGNGRWNSGKKEVRMSKRGEMQKQKGV